MGFTCGNAQNITAEVFVYIPNRAILQPGGAVQALFPMANYLFHMMLEGTIADYIGIDITTKIIDYTDKIYPEFGGEPNINGEEITPAMREIQKKSIEANLRLVYCPVRHLGTEKTQLLY